MRPTISKYGWQGQALTRRLRFSSPFITIRPLDVASLLKFRSVTLSPGASDDGSGVALALDILYVLCRAVPLKSPLVILFDNGEELNLIGSNDFLRSSPNALPGALA